jgi:hypothetical protein
MLWFPAYFVLAMFGSALQARTLGLNICFAVGLLALYPDSETAGLLTIFYLPAYLLASFRD